MSETVSYNGITVTPGEGVGTSELSVSAGAYTGRLDKSVSFGAHGTGSFSNVDCENNLVVTQRGGPSISLGNVSPSGFVPSAGGDITITGTSNLQKLTLGGSARDYLSNATICDCVLSSANISSLKQSAGYTVVTAQSVSDPGKDNEYTWSLTFGIQPNANTAERNFYVEFGYTVNSIEYKVPYTITQLGTGQTNGLSFNLQNTHNGNVTIELNAAGTKTTDGTITLRAVDSDTTWSISHTQNS